MIFSRGERSQGARGYLLIGEYNEMVEGGGG